MRSLAVAISVAVGIWWLATIGRTPSLALDQTLMSVVRHHRLEPLETRQVDIGPKFVLGRALFHDPILSGTRDVACVTCHLAGYATTDGLSASIGSGGLGLGEARTLLPSSSVNRQPRNSLDLHNRDHGSLTSMFWDGRLQFSDTHTRRIISPLGDEIPDGFENLMAAQAIFPILREDEMLGVPGSVSPSDLPADHANRPNEFANLAQGLSGGEKSSRVFDLLYERLIADTEHPTDTQRGYRALFQAAYPDTPSQQLDEADIGNAIARYEEVAFATRITRWDQYLRGERDALTESQKRGALLFFGKAGCAGCHSGVMLSDFEFYSIGVPKFGYGFDGKGQDTGRHRVTGNPEDMFKFRTPPLRNVARTAPYFHNGSERSLKRAVQLHLDPYVNANRYRPDGSFVLSYDEVRNISPILSSQIALRDEELTQLLAFLGALDAADSLEPTTTTPRDLPSGLAVPISEPPLSR